VEFGRHFHGIDSVAGEERKARRQARRWWRTAAGAGWKRDDHCQAIIENSIEPVRLKFADYRGFRGFGFGLCLACARSDPATDRTFALLLDRRSFEAFVASRFDVVIDVPS
jgi:hypothetical protein